MDVGVQDGFVRHHGKRVYHGPQTDSGPRGKVRLGLNERNEPSSSRLQLLDDSHASGHGADGEQEPLVFVWLISFRFAQKRPAGLVRGRLAGSAKKTAK